MRFRSRPWPRCAVDWCSLLFLLSAVAVTFISHVCIVLPSLFSGAVAWLHVALALFVLYNTLGNLVACMLVDSSTRGLLLPATCPPGWHFCGACEATAPPRAWHCETCGACVLGRDHHCVFSGCCIGHCNARYFFMLLVYLAVGAAYAALLNWQHIGRFLGGLGAVSIWQLLMPLAALMWSSTVAGGVTAALAVQMHVLVLSLDVVGGSFVSLLLFYHGRNAVRGLTSREQQRGLSVSRHRHWSDNMKHVLGARWWLVWVSPVVTSPLPSDGIKHETLEPVDEHVTSSAFSYGGQCRSRLR